MAKKKEKAPPNPNVQVCIDAFHDAHVERFGVKPDPRHWGRFGKEVKLLLSGWGAETVLALIRRFFATPDPRITRGDYSQLTFLQQAQYLHVRNGLHERPDEKTEGNL